MITGRKYKLFTRVTEIIYLSFGIDVPNEIKQITFITIRTHKTCSSTIGCVTTVIVLAVNVLSNTHKQCCRE